MAMFSVIVLSVKEPRQQVQTESGGLEIAYCTGREQNRIGRQWGVYGLCQPCQRQCNMLADHTVHFTRRTAEGLRLP
jgi:hypothetical protein